jgi:hypothetical protein
MHLYVLSFIFVDDKIHPIYNVFVTMPTKEGVKNINSRCKFACSQLGILKTRDDHVRLYDNLQMYI